jgi:ABC-2 type transport system ATP-binding protein
MAPQEIGIYPSLTVEENLTYAAKLADPRQPDADGRIREVIDALALGSMAAKQVQHLSGGQKRRVHVGMALVHRPALVMLDEPTAGVDIETREGLLATVRRLAEAGTAVCYSTHYMPEVEQLGASVAMIDGGRIVAQGAVQELISRHAQAALELTFEGPAPALDVPYPLEVAGHEVVIRADQPSEALALVLARLGTHANTLRSIQIVQPSLEMAYLALTGRRYQSEEKEEA